MIKTDKEYKDARILTPPAVSEAVLIRRRIEDCIRKNPGELKAVAEFLIKRGSIRS